MFDKFYNHLRIDAVLITETGLHIGAGEDSYEPTAPNGSVLRDATGLPYIPGSSLKGVLRAFLASVLDEPVVSAVTEELGDKGKRDRWKENKQSADVLLAWHIERESTISERLFGSQLMAGKVKLADARPKTDVKTDFRKGNAIDRDTHTTTPNALFDTESIPAGTEFTFRVDAENLTKQEAEILLQLLDVLAKGSISVGGRSRAGLGKVKLDQRKYTMHLRVNGTFPKTESTDKADDVLAKLTFQPEAEEVDHV